MFPLQIVSATRVNNFVNKVGKRVNSAIRECAARAPQRTHRFPLRCRRLRGCAALPGMPTDGGLIGLMCGRIIQSSGPLRYALVDGMNVRDSRVHNHPPRWNAAPSQELLVIRRNHKTGEVSLDPLRWGLIPYWCNDPAGGRKPINAQCESAP